ncbi:MAG: WbqC family protein [Myxococcales bacterium]|nr:WbqC family protein [Myxococcales bacterium]
MKIAVMQPTYLPWIGYFDLIDRVDAFVLLDDVEFSRQSWQQRNRIKGAQGLQWLTVPVRCSGRSKQTLSSVEVADTRFARKHLKSIEQHYRKSACYATYADEIEKILCDSNSHRMLSTLNSSIIYWLASSLGIPTKILRSSELQLSGTRGARVADICSVLGATSYVSPMGAAQYLSEDIGAFQEHGVDVVFHDYEHPSYTQLYGDFVPFAAAVDLLFNEGTESKEILRSGFRSFASAQSIFEALPMAS